MKNHVWKIINENPIIIDFGSCSGVDEIHAVLKEAFGFPNNYGKNWSAFEDYLDDFFSTETSRWDVHIYGFHTLPADLRKYCALMPEIMDDMHEKYPNAFFIIQS